MIKSFSLSVMAKAVKIVNDGKRTAKELWDKLYELYKTTNTQVVMNLKQEQEYLKFYDKKDFNLQISRIQKCDELENCGQSIEDSRFAQIMFNSIP